MKYEIKRGSWLNIKINSRSLFTGRMGAYIFLYTLAFDSDSLYPSLVFTLVTKDPTHLQGC